MLTQVRKQGLTPESLMSDGTEAGDFAIKYIIQHQAARVRKRTKPAGGKRGRPPKPKEQLLLINENNKIREPKNTANKKKRGRPKKVKVEEI